MLGWLAETTVVAGLLAMAALGASRWRSTSPAIRHVLWLVVLLKLVTPPLVAWPWAGWWHSPEGTSALAGVEKPPRALARAEGVTQRNASESIPTARHAGRRGPAPIVAAPAVDHGMRWRMPSPLILKRGLTIAWLSGAVVMLIVQTGRIVRFRRRLRAARPAPDDLVQETEGISRRLGVRAPGLLVIPDLGTPLLWCLGRPILLIPERLLNALPRDRWPAIILHELAHIKRRDHWVRRLDLLASLVWWWNPLFWLTHARLDAEAELACDAWVVSTLPRDRLVYAEVLYDICASLSSAGSPSPALGVAGAGRFVERRLKMILNDNTSCRLSPLALAAACLLLLLSAPSWLAAKAAAADPADPLTPRSLALAGPESSGAAVLDDKDDDGDDDADDDDDDDDEKGGKAKGRHEGHKAKKGESRHEEHHAKGRRHEEEDDDEDAVDELWEKLGKEMGKTFGRGSEFEKTFRELGEDLEKKFGPEFERTMKELGEELEKKLGPNSKFEKAMRKLGEELSERMHSKSEREEGKPHAKGKKHEEEDEDEEAEHAKARKHEHEEREHGEARKHEHEEREHGETRKHEHEEREHGEARKHEHEEREHGEARKHEEREHAKEKKHEDKEGEHGQKESGAREHKRGHRIHEIEKQIKKLHEELEELKGKGDKDEDEDDEDEDDDKD